MSRFFLIFAAALGLVPSSPAAAFCRMTVEEPMPMDGCPAPGTWLEWRRQCISYTLAARDDTSDISFDGVRDATDRSFARWTDVECDGEPIGLDLAQTSDLSECKTAEYSLRAPNANTIYFVDDWARRGLPFDAFGLTMIWHNPENGDIFDADMQLNENQGRYTVCGDTCKPGEVDLENVVTHEAGHFLGLGHSEVENATMHSRASIGETSKRSLASDDEQGLCEIYGHFDAPSCELKDYQPDNGFSDQCAPPEADLPAETRCACSAPGAGRRTPSAFWLLPLSLIAVARRRRR